LETTWTYTYVGHNLHIDQQNPDGLTVSTTFDEDNRPIHVVDPTNGVTDIKYDPAGNVLSRTNGRLVNTYTYDALNRVQTLTDGTGATTPYSYDEAGHTTKVTDPLGHFSTTHYDELGRADKVTDPNNHTTFYTFDEEGNVLSVTDPIGNIVRYTY